VDVLPSLAQRGASTAPNISPSNTAMARAERRLCSALAAATVASPQRNGLLRLSSPLQLGATTYPEPVVTADNISRHVLESGEVVQEKPPRNPALDSCQKAALVTPPPALWRAAAVSTDSASLWSSTPLVYNRDRLFDATLECDQQLQFAGIALRAAAGRCSAGRLKRARADDSLADGERVFTGAAVAARAVGDASADSSTVQSGSRRAAVNTSRDSGGRLKRRRADNSLVGVDREVTGTGVAACVPVDASAASSDGGGFRSLLKRRRSADARDIEPKVVDLLPQLQQQLSQQQELLRQQARMQREKQRRTSQTQVPDRETKSAKASVRKVAKAAADLPLSKRCILPEETLSADQPAARDQLVECVIEPNNAVNISTCSPAKNDSVEYDHAMLDDADTMVRKEGSIGILGALRLWRKANDAHERIGRQTLERIVREFELEPQARRLLDARLGA